MMNFSVVTRGMEALLKNNAELEQFNVTRGGYVNQDPGNDKWIGIYKGDVLYTPKTLGRGARTFATSFTLKVVVQSYGVHDLSEIDDILEDRIQLVMNAVNADRTIGSTVDNVVGFKVEYTYDEKSDKTMPFQLAIITISMEKRA